MPSGIIFLFIIAAIGLIALSIYFGYKRKKDLRLWAEANGLTFWDSRDHGIEHKYSDFSCFQQGSNRYGQNFMRGEWQGRSIEAFDYHYETHSTNSKGHRQTHHHHFSCVVIESELFLPPLFIRPESFFDKISEFVGYDDIDFESAEFSRRFYVKSSNRRWAYDVIHTRTMEFLLDQPQYYIQMEGRYVIAWRKSTFKPLQFGEAANILTGIFDRFPDYVVKQLKSGK